MCPLVGVSDITAHQSGAVISKEGQFFSEKVPSGLHIIRSHPSQSLFLSCCLPLPSCLPLSSFQLPFPLLAELLALKVCRPPTEPIQPTLKCSHRNNSTVSPSLLLPASLPCLIADSHGYSMTWCSSSQINPCLS